MSGTTPEGKVKKLVKRLLDEFEAYRFCPVQAGFGEMTLDFLVCYHGRFCAVETKAPGKHVTLRQQGIVDKMHAAGAKVFIIDGDISELETWLRENA